MHSAIRVLAEEEVGAQYDLYADEVEAFVSRCFDDIGNVVSSRLVGASSNPESSGALPAMTLSNSDIPIVGGLVDALRPQVAFSTFGPGITSTGKSVSCETLCRFETVCSAPTHTSARTGDVLAVAESLIENDATSLPMLFESLLAAEIRCAKSSSTAETATNKVSRRVSATLRSTQLTPQPQKWSKARRLLERRQVFSIFATRILEHRVLMAYQKAEMKREKLRNFRKLHGQNNGLITIPIVEWTSGITLFKPGDIEIDYTRPVNTSGASCDLLCGRHPVSGKVALKRLRSDMEGSARLHVGARLRSSGRNTEVPGSISCRKPRCGRACHIHIFSPS